MTTRLELFRKRMEPSEKLYTSEILDFTEKFDELGEMTLIEDPDIDTQEYIYQFENLNGTTEEALDKILIERYNHMDKFTKNNGIEQFDQYVCIWI